MHHGISDAAVRKAKKFGCVKADANPTSSEPACEPEPKPVGTGIDCAIKALPSASRRAHRSQPNGAAEIYSWDYPKDGRDALTMAQRCPDDFDGMFTQAPERTD